MTRPRFGVRRGETSLMVGRVAAAIYLIVFAGSLIAMSRTLLSAEAPSKNGRHRTFPNGHHQADFAGSRDADPDHSLFGKKELVVASMNIAACEPSQSAPPEWTVDNSTAALRGILLGMDADVIALQECPGGARWARDHFPGYSVLGATYSHADQVMLMVRDGLKSSPTSSGERAVASLPAVVAELELDANVSLLVASVHLEPFERGDRKRQSQMRSLLNFAESKSSPILIMGDTNMRDTEDGAMEDELGLQDIWKLAGERDESRYTWDTIDHRHVIGGAFNRYYGSGTRQYQRRYDRIYFHGAGKAKMEGTPTFELIANRPMTSKLDFLSDHFGMASRLSLSYLSE